MDLNYHIIIFTLSVFFILFINYKIRKGARNVNKVKTLRLKNATI